MLRLFGQVLAMLALLASVINAQCALSCSLQTGTRSQIADRPIHQASSASHACCPASRSSSNHPANRPLPPKLPCSQQRTAVIAAVEITPLQQFEMPLEAMIACGSCPAISATTKQRHRSEFAVFPGLPDRAAFAVMRV